MKFIENIIGEILVVFIIISGLLFGLGTLILVFSPLLIPILIVIFLIKLILKI